MFFRFILNVASFIQAFEKNKAIEDGEQMERASLLQSSIAEAGTRSSKPISPISTSKVKNHSSFDFQNETKEHKSQDEDFNNDHDNEAEEEDEEENEENSSVGPGFWIGATLLVTVVAATGFLFLRNRR